MLSFQVSKNVSTEKALIDLAAGPLVFSFLSITCIALRVVQSSSWVQSTLPKLSIPEVFPQLHFFHTVSAALLPNIKSSLLST